MNKTEKQEFVKFLLANIEKEMLRHVPFMPDVWSGFELRCYLQHIIDRDFSFPCKCFNRKSRRYKDFQNELATNGNL
jgi:hypothetical protein